MFEYMPGPDILNEYEALCLGNPVSGFDLEFDDFWTLELGEACFNISEDYEYSLRRIIFCIHRLKQLNTELNWEDLERRFASLHEEYGRKHRGCVLTFGKNDFQLGFGSDISLQPIPKRIDNEKRIPFDQVSAGRFHTMAVSSAGELYTWGKGHGGKLGHGDEQIYIIPTLVKLPQKVLSISTGRHHSMAIMEDGCLYTWGSNKFGQLGLGNVANVLTPTKVNVNKKKGNSEIVSVSASNSHSMCIREDGSVFCWGKNDSSQVGFRSLTNNDTIQSSPYKVSNDSFQGSKPVSGAISDSISLVLTSDGKVFQWGKGSPKPSKVVFTRESDVKSTRKSKYEWEKMRETSKSIILTSIATATFHSAAVSNHGEVFTWGSEANLLGYRTKSHTTIGRRINYFFDKGIKIQSISCAKRHSVVVDNKGYVYVWGHGDHGVLGLTEKQTYQPEPKLIPSLRSVKAVSAAECHTCVIVKEVLPCFDKPKHKPFDFSISFLGSDSEDESPNKARKEVALEEEMKPYENKSLQLLCEDFLLKDADIWNVLNYLSFGLRYKLRQVVKYSEFLILLNLNLLLSNRKQFLTDLSRIYNFEQLLKFNIEVSNPVNIQRRRYSIVSSVSSCASAITEEPEPKPTVTKSKGKNVKHPEKKTEKSPGLECRICGISAASQSSLVQHLAGKKHKKLAQKKKFQFQVASPVTPQYKPRRPKPQIVETVQQQPRFQLNASDFPKPSSVLTPISKKSQVSTPPQRRSTSGGYSLSDFLNKRKGRTVAKPSPWKKESQSAKATLSSIMFEQSNELREDKHLKQSSWGYNKVTKQNLADIQQEQIQENFIRQQKRLLRKYKRQAKARKKRQSVNK